LISILAVNPNLLNIASIWKKKDI